ncbi:DeoR/GlpR family DNA-binding transcription regulator [Angustibacter speluncae]
MAKHTGTTDTGTFSVERRARILDRLRADGSITVAALAAEFDLSTETIRRDLISLERAGSLRRVHGGAVLETHRGLVPDVKQRASLMTSEKALIAEAAAALVPVAALVLLDGGTTAKALAEVYPLDRATTVVTPSLTVATTLLERPSGVVHTLGGEVSPRTWSEGGSWTVRALENIRADIVFLGCSGFSAERGATTSDQVDGQVKRAMVAAARRVVVLADSSKIGSQHLTTCAEVDEIDVLVTGRNADADEIRKVRAAGLTVHLA